MKNTDITYTIFLVNLICFFTTVIDMIARNDINYLNFALFLVFLFNMFAVIMYEETFIKDRIFSEDKKEK